MWCRWLAVLILAGFLLVIEGIAVSQGNFAREPKLLPGNVFGNHNVTNSPTFETNVPRNVTTAVSQTAFLHCRVHQLGDKEYCHVGYSLLNPQYCAFNCDLKCSHLNCDCSSPVLCIADKLVCGTAEERGEYFARSTHDLTFDISKVSWMRKRDMHILSAGTFMYTSDLRFQVIHPDKSENWTLQIRSPQKRDSGVYECQVSTEPKMSLNYTLNVDEARARINGSSDMYVKTGSILTLTCQMSQGPHDLGTVSWYRGSQPVLTSPHSENDVNGKPRITVETEWTDALTSTLSISHAKLHDSGIYSCVPTVAEKASVNVHVINGEHPAAMQHGNTAAGSPTSKTVLVMLAFFLGQLR